MSSNTQLNEGAECLSGGDKKRTHGRIEVDGGDGGGRGLRQVSRQAQKATCTSHRDEERLQQLHEIAAGKKSS